MHSMSDAAESLDRLLEQTRTAVEGLASLNAPEAAEGDSEGFSGEDEGPAFTEEYYDAQEDLSVLAAAREDTDSDGLQVLEEE